MYLCVRSIDLASGSCLKQVMYLCARGIDFASGNCLKRVIYLCVRVSMLSLVAVSNESFICVLGYRFCLW
jgi:hypothetical protein